MADTPQLQPAFMRLSAIISQFYRAIICLTH
jgi:hypothetical protein